ncbi:MAG TPA: Rieske (2Fe-2S) protein [Nocardioides sp.]|nr:Rieske (2Fe-2S) protein [Nocardioides sp.]
MSEPLPSRRIVFQGLSALGVAAVLAGCGGEDRQQPQASQPSEPPTSEPSSPDKPSPGKKSTKDSPARELAATAEIPVGGGIVLTDARIVITQPQRGEFRAFSAVCTHEGQTVGRVEDNTITCLFHGSQYDAATGDVTTGPATAGLAPVRIAVKRGSIVRA